MNTNLMLILSAFLVITGGASLASIMNILGEYNVPSQKNPKFLVQDNDNEEVPDFDAHIKFPY